ncbi:MAG: glycine cleavage system aminomethyltransferase GcvT [Candidatus Omnitrophica bacterium]|nr:glycine cleavage system aminomethyltransferase GcvT [Candidatus Omnitrophota bacterium]
MEVFKEVQTRFLPLHDYNKSLGAKFIEFSGWEVPAYFTSIIEEHEAVRRGAGFFDISHMGEVHVRGEKALDFLQSVVCNDVSKLKEGEVLYTPLMLASGGVVDDILIYYVKPAHYFLIVNAANIDKDFKWFLTHNSFGVEVENVSPRRGIFAIQGPKSIELIKSIFGGDVEKIAYYHFANRQFLGKEIVLSRTGYTGEAGFEVFFDIEMACELHEIIVEKGSSFGLKPIGFGARDTLRLDVCFPLYGHELTEDTTPLEAGLSWTVHLDKGPFLGRDVLLAQKKNGIKKTLVGFEMVGRGLARGGYAVFHNGAKAGHVTSGGFSPSLKKNIGLAYVPVEAGTVGASIDIEIRGEHVEARIVKTPFYKKRR